MRMTSDGHYIKMDRLKIKEAGPEYIFRQLSYRMPD